MNAGIRGYLTPRIVIYLVLAVIGFFGTWWLNVQAINPAANYLLALFTNPAAASAALNSLVTTTAACIFIMVEGRRLGMRRAWILVPVSLVAAAAFTVPLFLAWREWHMIRAAAPVGHTTPLTDTPITNLVWPELPPPEDDDRR